MIWSRIGRMVAGVALAGSALAGGSKAQGPSRPGPLKVVGTAVVNERGERVRLRGVNAASLEWDTRGEGHILDTIRAAVQTWHANHVRLPLSQDRWFGKGPDQDDGGASYRALVGRAIDLCEGLGAYAMVDLHWSDAGVWGQSIGQHVMPDRNSLAFWKDFAALYKNRPAVIFDLYNEPHDVTWDRWLKGGPVTEKDPKTKVETTFEAVGMRELLDAVRATGARNVAVVGGLDWSYDLSGVLEGRRLSDPDGDGVIYANHAYPFKGDTVERWVGKMEAASKVLPIIVSEFGSEAKGGSGLSGEAWVRQVLGALEGHGWDWTAWDMHPAAAPCLISGWDYAPTPYFGVPIKEALAAANGPAKAATRAPGSGAVGIFEGSGDVGTMPRPGSARFDEAAKSYTITGGGLNMWTTKDAFRYAWKRASGDLGLAADIAFVGPGKDPHRKACLMIRQDLDEGSAYVDVAVHGDGLTSLQFRDVKGGLTHEVQGNITGPSRARIEVRGGFARMDLAAGPGPLAYSGASTPVRFREPFYVGLGVCAHDADASETAVFSRVELTSPLPPSTGKGPLYSTLETQAIASTDRRVVHVAPGRIEAPNWTRDGLSLLFNGGGRISKVAAIGGPVEVLDTGPATHCNNDHGISPDGTLLAISDGSQPDRKSRISLVPIAGGPPTLVTPTGPSYWHGWSPDGKTLAYCGDPDGDGDLDVYTIPAAGGTKTRLTASKGLDDGPEYSPDGKFLYFNSDRTGLMQIWRMKPDGSDPEPITADDANNWFAHPSPDGKKLAFVTFAKDVAGHPPDQDVQIRLMDLETRKIQVLARILGGQGTLNVPSWSPDGKKLAFVTYHYLPEGNPTNPRPQQR